MRRIGCRRNLLLSQPPNLAAGISGNVQTQKQAGPDQPNTWNVLAPFRLQARNTIRMAPCTPHRCDPHSIALGLATGVFMGFNPLIGFHLIIAAISLLAARRQLYSRSDRHARLQSNHVSADDGWQLSGRHAADRRENPGRFRLSGPRAYLELFRYRPDSRSERIVDASRSSIPAHDAGQPHNGYRSGHTHIFLRPRARGRPPAPPPGSPEIKGCAHARMTIDHDHRHWQ